MDALRSLMNTSNLKMNYLKQASSKSKLPLYFRYDREVDTLMLMFVHPETTDTVGHYVDDNVALLYDPKTKEILGLEIEAFEKSFLPQHANVAKAWSLTQAIQEEKPENFGDVILIFEKAKPKVAREIIKSTTPLLPRKIANWEPALV